MTAIVGIVHGGSTYIGWDSCVGGDGEVAATLTPKGWRAGGWLVAGAGMGGWFAVLRVVNWPVVADPEWPERGLVPALLSAAGSLGLSLSDKADDPTDGSALIGARGYLWGFDSSLDVSGYNEMACGSGGVAARAALHVVRGRPVQRIRRALEAAAAIVPGVSAPFMIERV